MLPGVFLVGLFACSSGPTVPEFPTWEQADSPFDISQSTRYVLYRHRASRDGPQGVYLLDLETDDPPRLLWEYENNLQTPIDPRLSPDATKIVMTRDFVRDIYVYDIETGEEEQVSFTNGNAKNPDWRPDGTMIAYVAWICGSAGDPDTTCGIVLLNLATKESSLMRHRGAVVDGADPRWSPDGDMLAIAKSVRLDHQTVRTHIFAITPDGSTLIDLTPRARGNNTHPVWLSDTEILYQSKGHNGVLDVEWRVVDMRTRQTRRWEAEIPFILTRREFSRDGTYVVYNDADPAGEYGVLYLQETGDLEGRARRQLTTFLPIEEKDGS